MIIREQDNHFILIHQTHHATLSGLMAKAWKEDWFPNERFRRSVEYAAAHHDAGWARFDAAPFWDDKEHQPYSFDTFPDIPKTVVYKHGIHSVMENDAYAGLLCSVHFDSFFKGKEEPELVQFVQMEKERQDRLRAQIDLFNEDDFQYHYGLLQLVDSLSLFVCLNEPGTPYDEGHPFFQNGIPVPNALGLEQSVIHPVWLDHETVALDVFPFEHDVEGSIPQTRVTKAAITEKGLLEGYDQGFEEEVTIRFVAGKK